MKWLIASDIHGSAYYCRRLMEARDREKPQKMILLGDLLYHGPRNDLPRDYAPKEVIGMLDACAKDILCVRGNCEARVDGMVLSFPVSADHAYLCFGDVCIFATHGDLYDVRNLPPLREGEIFLYGHTHIGSWETVNGIACLNPGSVSIPKGGSPHSYMTLSDGVFTWKDLDGRCFHTFTPDRREPGSFPDAPEA